MLAALNMTASILKLRIGSFIALAALVGILTSEGELRMLEALRIADNSQPVDIQRTLLAAHTVPEEFAEASDDYLALICEQLIPAAVATPGLLSACDAYLEQGAFDLQQVRRFFF